MASGIDEIPTRLIKNASNLNYKKLTNLVHTCLQTKKHHSVLIFKKMIRNSVPESVSITTIDSIKPISECFNKTSECTNEQNLQVS